MRRPWTLAAFIATLACVLAAAGALVAGSHATPNGHAAVAAKRIAGTVETKMVINNFTTVGKRVVGQGTVTSTQRNAAGAVAATNKDAVQLTLRQAQAGPGPCQILYLELDEVDLTLLGLRVYLRSATTGEPIRITLSADSTHGTLGKLFCQLSQTAIDTPAEAKTAATTLNNGLKSANVFQASATLYAANPTAARSTQRTTTGLKAAAAANCPVLHLILGPLHLDLLGLIVDLNKIALDIEAIPNTTVGNLFCSLVGGPPASTPTTTTPTTTTP